MAPAFRLECDSRGRLTLIMASGERHENVEPVRAFPLSDRRRFISICAHDGREILEIESLDAVDPDTGSLLEAELARREFLPVVLRIVNNPADSEPSTWQVETDRGVTTFDIESADNVHRRTDHEVSLIDTHGIRYVIPDVRMLDHHSRRILDRFL